MRAGKIKSYWIIIQSVSIVLLASLEVLVKTQFRHSRKTIDHIAKKMSKKLLNTIKLSYQVNDPHHLILEPNRRYIIMCNHASHYDIPLSFLAIPGSVRMITKKELFKVPVWGRAMQKAGFISVDRDNKAEARKALDYAKEQMENGIVIWIAPEGTRTKTGALQPFKKGGFMLAYQTKAIIIPVGIRGTFNILPPKTWLFHTHEQAEVHIGKPIDTANYKIRDRTNLMQGVENSIRELAAL